MMTKPPTLLHELSLDFPLVLLPACAISTVPHTPDENKGLTSTAALSRIHSGLRWRRRRGGQRSCHVWSMNSHTPFCAPPKTVQFESSAHRAFVGNVFLVAFLLDRKQNVHG